MLNTDRLTTILGAVAGIAGALATQGDLVGPTASRWAALVAMISTALWGLLTKGVALATNSPQSSTVNITPFELPILPPARLTRDCTNCGRTVDWASPCPICAPGGIDPFVPPNQKKEDPTP